MSNYHDKKAFSYCKLPQRFCNSKSIVNIQIDDRYCFLWCVLAQLFEFNKKRKRISLFQNFFMNLIKVMDKFPEK